MLELIIELINAHLRTLDMFAEQYDLCTQIREDDPERTYPAYYCTDGEFNKKIDLEVNLVYHRLTGDITQLQALEGAVSGCDEMVDVTYPVRTVACVSRDVLQSDDAYIESKVAENIGRTITTAPFKTLTKTFKAQDLRVEVRAYKTLSREVFEQEYPGFPYELRNERVLVAVDYNLILSIPASCLYTWNCDNQLTRKRLCELLTDADLFCALALRNCDQLNLLLTDEQKECVGTDKPVDEYTCDELKAGLLPAQRACIAADLSCAEITGNISQPVYMCVVQAVDGATLYSWLGEEQIDAIASLLTCAQLRVNISQDTAECIVSDFFENQPCELTLTLMRAIDDNFIITCIIPNANATELAALNSTQLQTIIAAQTGCNLNLWVSQSQRNVFNMLAPGKTGQTVSYTANDDGTLRRGRLVDWLTLSCNNQFGNTSRFTDLTGAQTYATAVVLDHFTGLMWTRNQMGTATFDNAVAQAEASTLGGFNDWHLCNVNELTTIANWGLNVVLGAPFVPTNTGSFQWTSNTNPAVTTQGIAIRWNSYQISGQAKTGSLQTMYCRTF